MSKILNSTPYTLWNEENLCQNDKKKNSLSERLLAPGKIIYQQDY